MANSDNKRAVDLVHGWSVGWGTKHMDCRIIYLKELKEEGIIRVQWLPSENKPSDIFTKNCDTELFKKHFKHIYCES